MHGYHGCSIYIYAVCMCIFYCDVTKWNYLSSNLMQMKTNSFCLVHIHLLTSKTTTYVAEFSRQIRSARSVRALGVNYKQEWPVWWF